MESNQNKTLVRRFFDEMCNLRKLNIADELFESNHAYHDPQIPDPGPGADGMKQVISTYQSAFPDAHWQVIEIIPADQHIITRWKATGTQKKELNGIQPTGQSVDVQGIWIHRFSNNKIVESWNVWDVLGMLQQLGVVPRMQQASTVTEGQQN